MGGYSLAAALMPHGCFLDYRRTPFLVVYILATALVLIYLTYRLGVAIHTGKSVTYPILSVPLPPLLLCGFPKEAAGSGVVVASQL